MGGTHEHLEHAEHAEHAAHDPFDRRVAMTMAIIAATLAGMTLLSHREHNETLAAKSESGIISTKAAIAQTEGNVKHTQASDAWSFYQAKNIRKYEFESFLAIAGAMAKEPGKEEAIKKQEDVWAKQVGKYEKELPVMMQKAKDLEHEGDTLTKKSLELRLEASGMTELSEFHHHRSDYFDVGHLVIEIALVICSIAVLTKMRSFWFTGIGLAVLGLAVGLSAFRLSQTAHGGGHGSDPHAPANATPESPQKKDGGHGSDPHATPETPEKKDTGGH